MRNDGSIALTKLNMSVIDSSAMISSEALLCASFAQNIIDKERNEVFAAPFTDLDFLEEENGEPEPLPKAKQVNLNYDLTFKMVLAHLEAIEKESGRKKNNEKKEVERVFEKERRLLERSLKILEGHSRFNSSPVIKNYREYLTVKERILRESSKGKSHQPDSSGGTKINTVSKEINTDLYRLIENETEIRSLSNELLDRNNTIKNIDRKKSVFDRVNRIINDRERINFINRIADNDPRSRRQPEETAKSLKRMLEKQRREIGSLKKILVETGGYDINTFSSGGDPYTSADIDDLRADGGPETLNKDTERVLDRQTREIRQLKQIITGSDIYEPLRINYNRPEIHVNRQGMSVNRPGFEPVKLDNINIDADRETDKASDTVSDTASDRAGDMTYDMEEKVRTARLIGEKQIREIRELKTIMQNADLMSPLRISYGGKSIRTEADNESSPEMPPDRPAKTTVRLTADRIKTLREIVPQGGTNLINAIAQQLKRYDMGFEPVDFKDAPTMDDVAADMDEKVRTAKLIGEKQIREIRELKTILGNAEILSPAKLIHSGSKQKKTGSREDSEDRVIKASDRENKLSEKTSEKASEKVSEKAAELGENLRIGDNIRNALNPLTREIALIKLLRGNNRYELRNISRLVHDELPWNSVEATDEIREKYIIRQMGYTPADIEDLLTANDEKDEEISRIMQTSARQERDIRELKKTIQADIPKEKAEKEKKEAEEEKKKEKREKEEEKRQEKLERSIEINETVRNALAPVIREIATIKLLRSAGGRGMTNISKLVRKAFPDSSVEAVNEITSKYMHGIMSFEPERLENILFEKNEGDDLPARLRADELPGAVHEREIRELKNILKKDRGKKNDHFYPTVNMEYGSSYPAIINEAVKKQLSGINPLEMKNDTAAEKFLRGEVQETVVEEPVKATELMKTVQKRITAPQNTTWVNPAFAGNNNTPLQAPFGNYGYMDDLNFKEKNTGGGKEKNTGQARLSDADIRRTADKVFKLVEERMRKERRRIGRI
ncbi:hypothetical protein QYZ88_018015 [Lachnospiraceae bacterium C1.1]|nr:hypothetical protein [Lachnospiraceae bacterium C1.1]